MRQIKRLRWLCGMALMGVVMIGGLVAAQSFTQGFASDEPLQRGILVRLNPTDSHKVQVATAEAEQKIYGVVVNANDAPVTLSTEGQKVFVASQGRFEVLVSSQNGPIAVGDYLVISSIRGVAMKAGRSQKVAVARALDAFDGRQGSLSSQKINGKTINISRIGADIAITHNPLAETDKTTVPKILQTASSFVAGRTVSAPRMYAGGMVLVLTMLISGGMFYTGTRSSITAIGRNPLSKHDITKGLLQVSLTSLIVFIIGLFAVYLLLKL